MENNLKFNSAICTSRVQSEHLLSLGLKKETADMTIHIKNDDSWYVTTDPYYEWEDDILPAWSLGRLIEMMPSPIPISEDLPTFRYYAHLNLSNMSVGYYWEDYDGEGRALVGFSGNGLFAAVVDATEWLIKEGNFPKEYLEE